MYVGRVYVKPEDILDKISDEHKDKVNKCVFTDAKVMMDGSVDISYVIFKDQDENKEYINSKWYFDQERIKL